MKKIRLNCTATLDETFADFLLSRRAKGLAEKTLESYSSQWKAVARHLDTGTDIAALQKADLDDMIVSMRGAWLSPNSINSYTRVLKSFFSWCNEQGLTRLNIPLYTAEENGDLDTYLQSDHVLGNIHRTKDLSCFVNFVQTAFQDASEEPPGLMFHLTCEDVTPLDGVRSQDGVTIVRPESYEPYITCIFDDDTDNLTYAYSRILRTHRSIKFSGYIPAKLLTEI